MLLMFTMWPEPRRRMCSSATSVKCATAVTLVWSISRATGQGMSAP